VSQSLFSGSWYRVASIRPRLRSHAQVHRHVYRGRVWYVLQDHASGRFHRFSPATNLVIGLMDGRRTLDEIWHAACVRLGDDAPTQDEVISLVASLHKADVLQSDAPPDIAELHERKGRQQRMQLAQYIKNPLSLRIPLFDPEPFLRAIAPLSRVVFGWTGLLLWLLVVGWAALLAGQNWNALTRDVTDQLLSGENLLLVGLVFPVAKLIHELGHAAAVKAFGGEVHETGVMLLVLVPIPYVDASASSAFQSKGQRMLVGAAGMMVELFIAALALFVWLNVEPGAVRAVAYNVILVAGISTLIFNANPLLRFDAYYILSDYLEIPNLAQRANNYIGYLTKRYAFRMEDEIPPDASAAEKAWFVFYGIGSFFYRTFVSLSIALYVATQYFVLGVLIAAWSMYLMVLQPTATKLAWLLNSAEVGRNRMRAVAVTFGVLAASAAAIAWVPVPSWTRTEGVAWAPEDATVRAAVDGFVQRVAARPGVAVHKGDALVETVDPELGARVAVLRAQLAEQEARRTAAVRDRVAESIVREEIEHLRHRLAVAEKKASELTLRSPGEGVFLLEAPQDLPGRYVKRGEVLGYVVDFSRVAVRVVVNQADIDLVQKMTRRVELRTVERIPEVVEAKVVRATPAATDELPSLALSQSGGGQVSLDPSRSPAPGGGTEARSATTLFLFDLEIADRAAIRSLGSRIYARFEREPEPLGTQWYRVLRRLLLEKFNV
jgi:putative peptide zinc metalloprotease protein